MDRQDRDYLLVKAMNEYGHYLTRLAYSFVKDEAKAEDIVQEVFIRYYLNMDNFEGRSSIKTYLYRITVNECHNYFKSWSYRKVEISNFINHLLIHNQTPEESIIADESSNELSDAIKKLPRKYREVLWLYYYAELSVTEIGTILNCSNNTVKTRLVRGRKMASLTFAEEGFHHGGRN
ncbi:sigma-70 family RNA polymerase sigma factor [Psychrobacillus sp. NPDC096426]|uniref:sigma-70 family RNA polymerase sigma factor n=1 Tax=Psychrobacillus sp. NPDC096426 TaxID=3364491 RepID=UPI0037F3C3FF